MATTDRVFSLSTTGNYKDAGGGANPFTGEIVVDTGNTAGLLVPNKYLDVIENRKPSTMRCKSASGDMMQIGEDGTLPINVSTEGSPVNFDLPLELDCTTSAELGQLILSIHPFFATGNYDFLWRPKRRGGCCIVKFCDGTDQIEHSIPMRYDHKSKTTYLDFNMEEKGNNPPFSSFDEKGNIPHLFPPKQKEDLLSFQISKSPLGAKIPNSPPRVKMTNTNYRIEGRGDIEPERNFLLYTKKNNNTMEKVSTQPEGAVLQYLASVPCIEYLLFCHEGRRLEMSPAILNVQGESVIVSAKRNLGKEKKRQPIALFSATHGHLGCQSHNCTICVRKMGNRVKLQTVPNCVLKEKKRGFRWRLDACTFDQRNFEGEKYAFILRDSASDAFEIMHGIYRSDFVLRFREWVQKIRSDPRMQGEEHVIVSLVKTDFDGVWREDTKSFQKEIEKLGVIFEYSPPERKEGGTESNVNIFEMTVKAILMQRNLPGQWWGQASRDAMFLLNRFPTSGFVKAPDGDTIRPFELLTNGMVSRKQIDSELDAYVTLGTLCLVHNEGAKGSQLAAKVKYGISYGMVGKVNRFKCPYTGSIFRSASFTLIGLPTHISYAQFLGLPELANRNCLPKTADLKIDSSLVCKLPAPREWQRDVLKDVEFTDRKGGIEKEESKFYIARKSKNGLSESDYSLNDSEYVGRKVEKLFDGYGKDKFKGAVTAHDFCRDSGDAIWEVTYDDGDVGHCNHPELMTMLMPMPIPTVHPPSILKIDPSTGHDKNIDMYVSKSSDTFQEACYKLDIVVPHHKLYYDWLPTAITDKLKYPFKKGSKNNVKLPAGIHFPNPHNKNSFKVRLTKMYAEHDLSEPFMLINHIMNKFSTKQSRSYINSPVTTTNYIITYEDPNDSPTVQLNLLRKFNEANGINDPPTVPIITPGGEKDALPYIFYLKRSSRKLLHLSPMNCRIAPPDSVADAVGRNDLELIIESWDSEMESLGKYGAMTHNHTKADLFKMGISTPPIPTRMLSDVKYKDGILEKYKGRCIAQGFRMIKGVHFDGKTFSPTPNQHTNKLLMALVAGEDLEILSFDISLAYTWGERDPANYPGGTKIALSYPPGLRRWNAAGEELFMVSHRSHYGLGPAGRTWFNTRQSKLLQMFNNDHWQSFVCTTEPCCMTLVHFPDGVPSDFKLRTIDMSVTDIDDTKLPTPIIATKADIESRGGVLVHMVTHVDDVDLVGKSKESLKEIISEVKKIWPIKEVGTDFMLGMKREKYIKDGVVYLRITQGACAREHYQKYSKYMPKKTPSLPMASGTVLTKQHAGETAAIIREVIDLGYQKVAGCVLWLARGVVPESLYAAGQVCSLMSCPSYHAWEVACTVLAYQTPVAENRGIVFRSDGNIDPIIFADAGFKPNPYTGKSHYGNLVMLYGGPVVSISKSLNHVGLSTPHVEVMAMNQGARVGAWIRQFYTELCRPITKKTLLLSDSSVAIHVTQEQIISEKNKFVLIAYHYIDELKNDLAIHFISTRAMLADVQTKNVTVGVFDQIVPLYTGTALEPFKFTIPT